MSLSWRDYLSSDPSFQYGLEVLQNLSESSSNVTTINANYEIELNILERYGLKELIERPFEHFDHDLGGENIQLIVDEKEKPIFIMPYEDHRLLDAFFSNQEFFDSS